MKHTLVRTWATLVAAATVFSATAEPRTWTTTDGKTFSGEYLEYSEAEGVLILVKGKERRIKLSKLSDEDKEFIGNARSGESKNRENSNFSDKWPTSTTMEDKLKAKAVKEDAGNEYVYETTHFRFISPVKLTIQTVSEMGRIFEGTYTACKLMPLNFPCRRFNFNKEVDEDGEDSGAEAQEKLVARLYQTRADYEKTVGPGQADSAGLFRGREGDVLVPFSSLGIAKKGSSYAIGTGKKQDAGTLIHELTHQMSLFGAGYDVPIWFAEGIAEYMRLANYQRGRFDLKGVGKNIKGYITGVPGRNLGKSFSALSLQEFLGQSTRAFQAAQGDKIQFNYGFSTLLVYYFIHLDGKGDGARIKRWMRDLQETKRKSIKVPVNATPEQREAARLKLMEMYENPDYNYDKLLDGRSWVQLEKEFAKKVSKLGIEVKFCPPTTADGVLDVRSAMPETGRTRRAEFQGPEARHNDSHVRSSANAEQGRGNG